MPTLLFRTGAVLALLAVALGAFGAHALSTLISPESLKIWQTASQYHLAHAIAVCLCAVAASLGSEKTALKAGWGFTAGIFIFSGSLYLLALTGVRILGAVTPLGGLCFMGSWAYLAFGVKLSSVSRGIV